MEDKEDVVHEPGIEYPGNCKLEAEKWNLGKEAGMQERTCIEWYTAL